MSDIDNLTFFRIVDKQIREAMQQVETEMLPTAVQAVKDTGLTLEEFPVEGYYGKTPALTAFFHNIRTLQTRYSPKVTDSVRRLHDFYTSRCFGLGQAVATAVNSDGVWYPNERPTVLSGSVDQLTIAVSNVAVSPATVKNDLTIDRIAQELRRIPSGHNLVGFGLLVDLLAGGETPSAGQLNPVATTLARETTVLSAYVPTLRCISSYKVSGEVESHGNAVIDAYNCLFTAFGSAVRIPFVTRANAFGLNHDLPDMRRCVRIFNLELPGQEKEYYHWAISSDHTARPWVIDFWRNEVVTTDAYQKGSFGKPAARRGSDIIATPFI